jgi:hypothetical protein
LESGRAAFADVVSLKNDSSLFYAVTTFFSCSTRLYPATRAIDGADKDTVYSVMLAAVSTDIRH